MEILRKIPVRVGAGEVARVLRMDEKLARQLNGDDLVKVANSLVDAKAVYTAGYIDDRNEEATNVEGRMLTSRVLAKKLQKLGRVFPYIVTIGGALENEAATRGMLQRLFLENAADLAISLARVHLEKYVAEKYELGGVSHLGPGQLDWPIQQQKELFSFFQKPEAALGVRLTESLMMVPRKSVSGLIFPTEATFTACQLCPKENCPQRQAPYSESLRVSHGLEIKQSSLN